MWQKGKRFYPFDVTISYYFIILDHAQEKWGVVSEDDFASSKFFWVALLGK